MEFLQACWKRCLEADTELPLKFVRRYDDSGNLEGVSEAAERTSLGSIPLAQECPTAELPDSTPEPTIQPSQPPEQCSR